MPGPFLEHSRPWLRVSPLLLQLLMVRCQCHRLPTPWLFSHSPSSEIPPGSSQSHWTLSCSELGPCISQLDFKQCPPTPTPFSNSSLLTYTPTLTPHPQWPQGEEGRGGSEPSLSPRGQRPPTTAQVLGKLGGSSSTLLALLGRGTHVLSHPDSWGRGRRVTKGFGERVM